MLSGLGVDDDLKVLGILSADENLEVCNLKLCS